MPDITSINAGLSAVKLAFGMAKDLKDASAAFNDAELRLKISDLYNALSEARMSLADAKIEIVELQTEVQRLESKLKETDELVYRDGFYYRAEPIDGKPNGPFCPKCYEGMDKLLSSVNPATGIHSRFGKKYCHVCKSHF
ncbi:hypothetical protein [Atlantibacter hermannii]|uniref:hypothetical protein n=1 Tax=Atlantibacter hermannii TaxID=565 RepID=UPI003395055E